MDVRDTLTLRSGGADRAGHRKGGDCLCGTFQHRITRFTRAGQEVQRATPETTLLILNIQREGMAANEGLNQYKDIQKKGTGQYKYQPVFDRIV